VVVDQALVDAGLDRDSTRREVGPTVTDQDPAGRIEDSRAGGSALTSSYYYYSTPKA